MRRTKKDQVEQAEVEPTDLTFEFYTEIPNLGEPFKEELWVEVESRLHALAAGHTDMTGASVALEQPAHAESPYLYQVRIVVYSRPDHVAATEKGADLRSTLKGTLDAIERQVRERRAKLTEHWKQP
jgi:ribosome-associated translation inhibitor RaiA